MARDDGSNSFLWFLAGLGIGGILGVLYAPKSGSETRELIRRQAEEGRDYVVSGARRAREQAGEWIDRGKETLSQQKENWVQAVQAGKQAYRESTQPGDTADRG